LENPILVIIIVFGSWLIFLSLGFFWLTRHTKKRIIESVPWEEFAKDTDKKFGDLQKQLKKQSDSSIFFIQKIGFLRFNPFEETGGDHSFSISLLDGRDNGFVLTSLHTRSSTRTYAKAIKNGTSPYGLSKEELKVIQNAKTDTGFK